MKPTQSTTDQAGFTFVELLLVLVVIAVLAFLLMPSLARAKSRAQRISCAGRLAQISLGFKQWSLDHTNVFPMSLSTNFGGTQEWIPKGETFRHFEVMSNELNTPLLLACPSDAARTPLRSFSPGFNNSNVSYFVALVASDDQPQRFLAGDWNIYSGVRPADGVVGLTTNNTTGWGPGLHYGQGNVALADGSVQGFSSSRLLEALGNTGVQTNWLQLP